MPSDMATEPGLTDAGARLGDMADELGRITADLAAMMEQHEAEAEAVQRATQQLLLKVAEAVCDLDQQDERLQSVTAEHARQIAAIRSEMGRGACTDDAPLARVRLAPRGPAAHQHVDDDGLDCRLQATLRATWRDADAADLPFQAPALDHLLQAMDPFLAWATSTAKPFFVWVTSTAKLLELGTFGPRSVLAAAALSLCIAALPRQPSV